MQGWAKACQLAHVLQLSINYNVTATQLSLLPFATFPPPDKDMNFI